MASGLLSLKWNHHRSTFLHVLANIRQKESYCDVTLACAGKFYSAHKLVLSTCSEYFEEMFERTQCKHPVIVLKDIGADELEALLSYMYDGEVNVLQENLSSLIKAAECLKIKGLAVADSDPSEHSSKSTKDKSSSSSSSNSNGKDVHRSHNSNSTSNSNNHSFQSDSSSRQFRNSSGGVKRPSLSSKQDDGPSKRRRPEPSSLSSAAASPARRQSTERPSSAPRGGAADAKDGDDGGSDGADGGEDGGNSMEGTPSAVDDQPHEDGGPEDARSFAQGLSEQTGVKAEPVEIIDSDDMGGFDPQTGDGGSHDASDAEFTEEKFASGGADANDPSLWGGGANNDMFSQPSTSSFTGQDGSNSNDNNSGGGKGGGGGSSMTADQYLKYLESNTNNNNMSAGAPSGEPLDVHQAHQHYLERYLKRQHSQHQLSVALLPPPLLPPPPPPAPSSYTSSEKVNLHQKQMLKVLQQHHQQQFQQQQLSDHLNLSESARPSPIDVSVPDAEREANPRVPRFKANPVAPTSTGAIAVEPSSGISPRRSIPRIDIDRDTQASLLERFVDGQRTKCPYCNFACVRKDNFKIHLRRHTGEKPYVCCFCLKGFASKPEMSIHEKTHTGEKDYLCPHCDYRGKRKYNLQMHLLNRHHRDAAFPH